MSRRTSKGWTRGNVGRCRQWEDRAVKAHQHTSDRRRIVQVRCTEAAGHRGPHRWRGVPFGTFTRETLAAQRALTHECGAPRRSAEALGEACRVRVAPPHERCPHHRAQRAPRYVSQLRKAA